MKSEDPDVQRRIRKLQAEARSLKWLGRCVCGFFLLLCLLNIVGIAAGTPARSNSRRISVIQTPILGHGLRMFVARTHEAKRLFTTVEYGLYAALAGFIWYGGQRMEQLKDYRLAVRVARLALFPWLFTAFPLGAVAGWFALRQLRRPEIEAQFIDSY